MMDIVSSISTSPWLRRDHAITSREGVANTRPPTEHWYDAVTAFHGSDDESVRLPRFDGHDAAHLIDDLNELDPPFEHSIGVP